MNDKILKPEVIHCNTCRRETEHKVIHSYRNKEFVEDIKDDYGIVFASIDGHHDWQMLECQGCKTVCMRSKEYFSEWLDPYIGGDPYLKTYFPPRNISARPKPHWAHIFESIENLKGHFILTAYEQIYSLVESEKYLAAMLTCRALLETIAIENGDGDLKTFEQKLKALRDRGFIREKQIEYLNKIIYDAGSAAMHRSYNPSPQAVTYVFDAVEQLLHSIYIEPYVEMDLIAEKPARK